MTPSAIEQALDRRHATAQRAFAERDIAAYRDMFGSALQYRQIDGVTIDRTRLMRDVAAQFAKIRRAESRFTRERLDVAGDDVRETLIQTAVVEVAAFGFLRRVWQIERRGDYVWAMEEGDWRIVRVTILEEDVRGRFRLG
ncbi:hypothetical protein ACSBM8_01425 [Sphingomonas sp. ASY06-1R]|jgi:hypothetical protein|uniref:hypothetical protein n=1 Tax=Sphingomonas sp. ASY06-1R TaxID=3445771 RepID=UPI003FA20CFC